MKKLIITTNFIASADMLETIRINIKRQVKNDGFIILDSRFSYDIVELDPAEDINYDIAVECKEQANQK